MSHFLANLQSAFNTDGIDVAGHNIHIHDVSIWTQDDCIAVKDNLYGNRVSSNMTFERIHASGLGLVIGSISGTTVQNITFRDSFLYRTYKGIYTKFRLPQEEIDVGPGLISDIVYKNITMESPLQWPIWIGPAQQTRGDSAWLCDPSPCSLCWPNVPFQQCHVVPDAVYRNIRLTNVRIRNPAGSPGVIMGDEIQWIEGITFENVTVETKSVSIPHEELRRMFPSLDLPVDDKIAKRTISVVHWGMVVFLFAVGLFFAKKKRASNTTGTGVTLSETPLPEQSSSSSKILCQFIAKVLVALFTVIVLVTVLVLTYDMLFVVPQTASQSKYFRCEGVRNGVAIGTTFPVPECFADMTIQTNHDGFGGSWKTFSDKLSLLMVTTALVLLNVWLLRCVSRSSNANSRSANSPYESVALAEQGDQDNERLIEEANIEDAFTLLTEDEEFEDTVDNNPVGDEAIVGEHP
eukprot:scaffold7349_cov173-Amphora_coffeaeformis.AAC.9